MTLPSPFDRYPYAWFGAAGLVACVLIGCNSEPQTITAQNSKFQVDDGTSADAAATSGSATSGSATSGSATSGSATSGSATSGSATSGSATSGSATSVGDRTSTSTGTSTSGVPATSEGSFPPGQARTSSAPGAARNPSAADGAGQPAAVPPRPSSTPPPSVQSASAQAPAQPLDRNDPNQLVAYLAELLDRQPRGTTREEAMSRYEGTQNEIIDIANTILALPADNATMRRAAEGKIQALSMLAQLGRNQATSDLRVFLANIAKSEIPELARLGKRMTFAQRMDAFANEGEADPEKLVKEFQTLFDEEGKDAGLFFLGNQVASLFLQKGKTAEALSVMKLTRDTFAAHSDPEIAKSARSLGEQLRMVELDVNSKLSAYLKDEPNSERALLDGLDQVLAAPDAGQATLDIVRQRIAPLLESRNLEAAAHVYGKLRASFEKHADQQLASEAVASAESFAKRKAIIGQPFFVNGRTLAGAPFDWAKYQGKVVLVDFWATWCGPCLEEIPNIRANYDQYHDQGFEVVGVNLDDDMQSVQRYFSFQKVPWETVVSADPDQPGMANPLAVKCGVEMIPFLVLVGRDGKAITLNARGEELGHRLSELFPTNAPPSGAPPAKGAEQAAPGKTSYIRPRDNSPQRPVATRSSFVTLDVGDADSPAASSPGTNSPGTSSLDRTAVDKNPVDTDDSNPYLAPAGLSARELVGFIGEMQDKPQSIQRRPGFSAAVVEAADRVLAASGTTDPEQRIAILAKVAFLHRVAEAGDPEADKQLVHMATRFQADTREDVAREVRFIRTEQAALSAARLPREEIPAVLESIRSYLERETLTDRHLRMASSIVEAINRLSDEDFRENRFQDFGKLFAKSDSRALTRYGNRLSETPAGAVSQWMGKPVELTGSTILGVSFNWTRYRGKVVLIDFWATWCGPCRAELPLLKAFHEKFSGKGFDVVGVSVDKDTDALAEFLAENEFPWTTLAGQEALNVANRLGVRGLPTMLLIDQEGKLVALGHSVAELAERVESLLASRG